MKNDKKVINLAVKKPIRSISYLPKSLPLANLNWRLIQTYLGEAHRSLGRLDTYLETLPSAILSFTVLTVRESIYSSRIAGVRASTREFLTQSLEVQKPDPYREDILNYTAALNKGFELLEPYTISKRLITEIHQILMAGEHGKSSTPGLFRSGSTYVDKPSQGIERVAFIPPYPEKIDDVFRNLESYINSKNSEEDPLVQLAIIHAQLEAIHPFFDGNGRIGRILIPLFLHKKHIVKTQNLYVSRYLEKNKKEYYHRLDRIIKYNEWENWIILFLNALNTQATEDLTTLREASHLYTRVLQALNQSSRFQHASKFADLLFKEPIIGSVDGASKRSGINRTSLHKYLNRAAELGILKKIKGGVRGSNVTYRFTEFLDILI